MPYLITVCLLRSSAPSIGDTILSTVRKAARLAVYDDIIIRVKNHQTHATILVDIACGATSEPTRQIHLVFLNFIHMLSRTVDFLNTLSILFKISSKHGLS